MYCLLFWDSINIYIWNSMANTIKNFLHVDGIYKFWRLQFIKWISLFFCRSILGYNDGTFGRSYHVINHDCFIENPNNIVANALTNIEAIKMVRGSKQPTSAEVKGAPTAIPEYTMPPR